MIAAALVVLLGIGLCSCGGSELNKAIKQAYIDGDTTQARYDKICSIITDNPKRYSDYVTDDGQINLEALQKLVTEVGQGLRPPMQWNVMKYGAASQLSLTIYFERSGSMVPYDSKSGGGQLKSAVNDLINTFPGRGNVDIKIVNDDIYPYQGTVDSFLQDRDIYATTRGTGNADYTDFKLILSKIFNAQKPGNVSVLVTDLIYSPRDTKDVSVSKIFNEERGVATSVFRQHDGKAVIVSQLQGDYDGLYYPYNGKAFSYRGQRPFYLLVIADASTLDRMASDKAYQQFLHPSGVLNSYRFNQAETQLRYNFLPQWRGDAGRFRPSHDDEGTLTDCAGDKETGILTFSIAADLGGLQKTDAFLTDANNYDVQSQNGFTIKVEPINPAEIKNNNRAYLEGMTHIITLSGKFKTSNDEVRLTLRNDFPQWIGRSTSRDDSSAQSANFAGSTFGLEEFLRGIFDAFSAGQQAYSTLTISLK